MSDITPTGHLKIIKVYDDGSEEIHFDDSNVIVSGMGVALSYLFAGSGATNIIDYQLDRFQLGVSGTSSLQTSTTYNLSGSLSSTTEYVGSVGKVSAVTGRAIENGAIATGKIFGLIPFSHVTRVDESSVKYTITVDKDSCNEIHCGSDGAASLKKPDEEHAYVGDLNEIGLFMKNPTGDIDTKSLLVAYRWFRSIRKTEYFGLVFEWTLSF